MCYPIPGPRCSGHMKTKLNEKRTAYENNPTPATLEAYEAAKTDYNKTPEGIQQLQTFALATISIDPERSTETFRLAAQYEQERATRIAARDAIGGNISKFVKNTQDISEVPAAYRHTAFGYRNDDPLGMAVDGFDATGGFRPDSTYEVTENNIVINTVWTADRELTDTSANQYFEVNALDEDQRPSPEQAEAIAKDMNTSFLENENEAADETLSDWEQAATHSIADSLTEAHDFSFTGGDSVKDAMRESLSKSVIFRHSYADAPPFDGDYVLSRWDDLYGD